MLIREVALLGRRERGEGRRGRERQWEGRIIGYWQSRAGQALQGWMLSMPPAANCQLDMFLVYLFRAY